MASKVAGNMVVPVWVDGRVVKALVDDDGRIHVHLDSQEDSIDVNLAASDITLGVTESSPVTTIIAQLYEYTGTVWRKKRSSWVVTLNYGQVLTDTDASVDEDQLAFSTVPAGQKWVVEAVAAVDVTTQITSIEIGAMVQGVAVPLQQEAGPVAGIHSIWNGRVTLGDGDYMYVVFKGTVAGDDISASVCGYKMLTVIP